MNATSIKTATVKIKYVNSPKEGKTRGSVKGTNNEFFGVDVSKLSLFEVGMTYDIRYTENGEWRTVVSATLIEPERKAAPQPATRPAAAPVATSVPGGDINRQTHPIDAERMFVCSMLNASIAARVIDPRDLKEMGQATTNFKRLWSFAFMANRADPASERMDAAE
jgi:hypothetical protein